MDHFRSIGLGLLMVGSGRASRSQDICTSHCVFRKTCQEISIRYCDCDCGKELTPLLKGLRMRSAASCGDGGPGIPKKL